MKIYWKLHKYPKNSATSTRIQMLSCHYEDFMTGFFTNPYLNGALKTYKKVRLWIIWSSWIHTTAQKRYGQIIFSVFSVTKVTAVFPRTIGYWPVRLGFRVGGFRTGFFCCWPPLMWCLKAKNSNRQKKFLSWQKKFD